MALRMECHRVIYHDTQQIQRELDDLDISLTPDFTDCMKLLNRAEKKVHNLNDDSLMDLPSTTNYRNNDDFIDDYKSKDIPEYKSNDRLLDDIPSSRPYSSLPESGMSEDPLYILSAGKEYRLLSFLS
jgi:hypothetical protein